MNRNRRLILSRRDEWQHAIAKERFWFCVMLPMGCLTSRLTPFLAPGMAASFVVLFLSTCSDPLFGTRRRLHWVRQALLLGAAAACMVLAFQ